MSEDVPQYGEMNEQRAREILDGMINRDAERIIPGLTMALDPDCVSLEGDYTADELEAIAWWMRWKPSA